MLFCTSIRRYQVLNQKVVQFMSILSHVNPISDSDVDVDIDIDYPFLMSLDVPPMS